jgi:hypothetical protein
LEPLNPFGCWDWWGYTNFNYAVKAGRQVTTLKAMLDRLTGGYITERSADIATHAGVVVNDFSDTAVALAWAPVAGARGYTVSRASGDNNSFAQIGSVSQPSFGDMGLRPATSYRYKVIVTLNGGSEGPALPIVTAATLPTPPRCDTPGSCAAP